MYYDVWYKINSYQWNSLKFVYDKIWNRLIFFRQWAFHFLCSYPSLLTRSCILFLFQRILILFKKQFLFYFWNKVDTQNIMYFSPVKSKKDSFPTIYLCFFFRKHILWKLAWFSRKLNNTISILLEKWLFIHMIKTCSLLSVSLRVIQCMKLLWKLYFTMIKRQTLTNLKKIYFIFQVFKFL